ncbi:hypothetical protein BBJ29_005093 [Phytophthora kernoviae]|uniref:Uncharacterized protein n=1 Tax=Phytophthora kernoviae TaxID=325452 RepID=A0A3F2RL06_9STRA|nr:hypothetical protein BBP00_00006451 [Phytophthora kernoviae]RLN71463.1 hypothetical protein BBJ29_005093 [Phytophthora kernoviae]
MGWHEFVYVSQLEWERMLLEEEENRRRLTRTFEVTQKQVEEDHACELEKITQARDNDEMLALEHAAKEHEEQLAAQLQKQARQLEFAVLVHDDYESHKQVNDTSNASTTFSAAQVRAQLLEKFAKRDTTAISMIYKAIRLTTDILSTTPITSVGSTAGQFVSADITQAVLSCVKELKALKEYLVQSLEHVAQAGGQILIFAEAPFAKWMADAVARAAVDKESAIDLALCSHREFMAFAQVQLQTRQDEAEETLTRLQQLFRVEVFNSDTEQQQQTVYVTWIEMLTFLQESSKAARQGIALPVDPDMAVNVPQHVRAETMDILFERVRVYGKGTGNILLGFE